MTTTPTGFEDTLTPAQGEALRELKQRLEVSEYAEDVRNHPDGDRWVLRFLRATMKDKHSARIFNVAAADARIRKTLKWRRDRGVDEMMRSLIEGKPQMPEGYLEICKQSIPFLMLVNEETGDIYRFDRFGASMSTVDVPALSHEQWERCIAFTMESKLHMMRQQSRLHGREISTYSTVVDNAGIAFGSIVSRYKFVQFMSDTGAEHYPESLGKTWLVNCPWYFSKIWAMIKPFIDKDTLSKLFVHSGVPEKELLNAIPRTLLLKEYGGDNDRDVLPTVPGS